MVRDAAALKASWTPGDLSGMDEGMEPTETKVVALERTGEMVCSSSP